MFNKSTAEKVRPYNGEKTVSMINNVRKLHSYKQNSKTEPLAYTIQKNRPKIN